VQYWPAGTCQLSSPRKTHINRAWKNGLATRRSTDRPVTPVIHQDLRPRFSRRTLQDNAYQLLREGLMSGEFAPGERLTVRGVAAAIGTSTMPVREAFRRLTAEGGLEPLSTGATRVPTLDALKLRDLTEIRLAVEGLAVRRAARFITNQEFAAVEQADEIIRRAVRANDAKGMARANEQFHFSIYGAARADELVRIIEHLWLQIGPWLNFVLKQAKPPQSFRGSKAFRHHADILSALRRRDEDRAEAALRADLTTAAAILVDLAEQSAGAGESSTIQRSKRSGARKRRAG
jgi:DNA-binding GntR family transcriptional regulator